jgi:hypothetical protein
MNIPRPHRNEDETESMTSPLQARAVDRRLPSVGKWLPARPGEHDWRLVGAPLPGFLKGQHQLAVACGAALLASRQPL